METTTLNWFALFFTFAALLPTLMANIADFDEVWQKRAEEAREAALKAYIPDPSEVTDTLNREVHRYAMRHCSPFANSILFLNTERVMN